MLGWFRRHATVLMVVLGSAAMVIFGLGPVFDRLSQGAGSQAYENKTLASWKGGDLTEAELETLRVRHYDVQRFLGELQEQSAAKLDTYRPLAIPVPQLSNNELTGDIMSRVMFAEKAKQEGFVASDVMVNSYISMISADAGFSENELEAMNRNVNPNVPFIVVKEQLKTELLYMQMMDFLFDNYRLPVPNVTEGMQLYFRTHEQIECQLVPLMVDDYLAQVKSEPSPSDIKRLFEEGKTELPWQSEDGLGFKIPNRANIQYFKANFETFLENAMNEITDQQVQEEYDRLVEAKHFIVMEPIANDNSFQIDTPPPSNDQPAGEGSEGDGDQPSPPPGDESAAPGDVDAPPADPEMNQPEEAGKEADGDKTTTEPADPEAGQQSTGENQPAAEGQSDPKPADENAGNETEGGSEESGEPVGGSEESTEGGTEEGGSEGAGNEAGEGGDQSRNGFSLFDSVVSLISGEPATSFVSLQEPAESGSDQQQSEGVEEQAGSENAEPEKTGPDQESTDTSEVPVPPQEVAPETLPGALGDMLQLEDNQPTKPEQEQKAKPLKDVAEDVKRMMAQEPARNAMKEAITKASVEIGGYMAALMENEIDSTAPMPKPLDFEDIADRYNLEFRETGMVDSVEFEEDEFGSLMGMNIPYQVFSQYDKKRLFEPEVVQAGLPAPNMFAFWFEEKQDTRVPTLKEAEPKIVDYWKQQEAKKLALADANSIAEKANRAEGKSLKDLYPEKAMDTGAFTWFNSQSRQISQPFGATGDADDDFMQVAFSLKPGQAGVVEGASNDRVFVIECQAGPRSMDEVGREYLKDQFGPFRGATPAISSAASYYRFESIGEVTETLRNDLEFQAKD